MTNQGETVAKKEDDGSVGTTTPDGRWAFDAGVTDAFDDMLHRSVPDHDRMRQLCHDIGRRFVRDKTAVVDLGCSRGEAMAAFLDEFGARCRFVGVEISEPMREACKERFRGWIGSGIVDIRGDDLRTKYPPVNASLTLCVLTLMFVPLEHRQKLVRRIWESTLQGGALILVEKTMGSSAVTDQVVNEVYWSHKREMGYTQDAIDRKRMALEGVLVPVTARWCEELLTAAGFRWVEMFWSSLCFKGWLAVKE